MQRTFKYNRRYKLLAPPNINEKLQTYLCLACSKHKRAYGWLSNDSTP